MAIRLSSEKNDLVGGHVIVATDETGRYATRFAVDMDDWHDIVHMALVSKSARTLVDKLDTIYRPDESPIRKESRS